MGMMKRYIPDLGVCVDGNDLLTPDNLQVGPSALNRAGNYIRKGLKNRAGRVILCGSYIAAMLGLAAINQGCTITDPDDPSIRCNSYGSVVKRTDPSINEYGEISYWVLTDKGYWVRHYKKPCKEKGCEGCSAYGPHDPPPDEPPVEAHKFWGRFWDDAKISW
jgi:hypothetical protein